MKRKIKEKERHISTKKDEEMVRGIDLDKKEICVIFISTIPGAKGKDETPTHPPTNLASLWRLVG